MTLLNIKKLVDTIVNGNVTKTISNLIQYVLIAVISVVLLYPERIFDNFTKYQDQKHAELVEKRLEIGPEVQSLLNGVSVELSADRVFVCEFHNGTNNFAGLPFLYLDMKYEVVAVGVPNVDDEYVNFNLTKYTFAPYALRKGCWYGKVDAMEAIDSRFAANMRRDGIEYMAGRVIYCGDRMVGVIGIAYEDCSDIDEAKIKQILQSAADKLGGMLGGS